MRRLATCLILGLALAAPAAAQQRRIPVVPPAAEPAALRGPISAPPARFADAAAGTEDPAPAPPPAPAPAAPAVPAPDARQCRMTCSRDYYFCLAGEDDRCPQHWSRCVTGCGS